MHITLRIKSVNILNRDNFEHDLSKKKYLLLDRIDPAIARPSY